MRISPRRAGLAAAPDIGVAIGLAGSSGATAHPRPGDASGIKADHQARARSSDPRPLAGHWIAAN